MAKIDLSQYETVEERLARFKRDYPNSDVVTELVDVIGDIDKSRWTVKASIWKEKGYDRPDATGYAFEIDGKGMTQGAAALETCETSAVGRALANLGYSGNKRVTREEMLKAKRHEVTQRIAGATTVEELNQIFAELKDDGIQQPFLKALSARKGEINGAAQQQQQQQPAAAPAAPAGAAEPSGAPQSGTA